MGKGMLGLDADRRQCNPSLWRPRERRGGVSAALCGAIMARAAIRQDWL
jgi:hypothetical protein